MAKTELIYSYEAQTPAVSQLPIPVALTAASDARELFRMTLMHFVLATWVKTLS